MVARGADVHAQDNDNATPLHLASYHGRDEIAKLLLDHGANAQVKDNKGRSPLHEVSPGIHLYKWYYLGGGQYLPGNRVYPAQNAFNVALLLLDRNADVNALDNDYTTPLHLASSHGILEVARLLLERGATANVKNVHGQTPLHLVSQCADLCHENSEVARLFLEIGMDVNVRDNCLGTPLHFACSHGNLETAQVLLDHGAEPNAQNADGQTPLHRVSQDSHIDEPDDPRVAQLMLERGANVNALDQDHETPLHLALYKSNTKTVQVLLGDHDINVNVENVRGQTPLHLASLLVFTDQGSKPDGPEVVQLLLGLGANVNARDKDLASPLHLASSRASSLASHVALVLLDNGADVNAVNIHGQNSLHILLQEPNALNLGEGLARLLLDRGVDVHGRDKDETTPLHLACYNARVGIAMMLLDHGAQVKAEDIRGQTPLHQVPLGNRNYKKISFFGPLLMPQWYDKGLDPSSYLAQKLLACGADVNAQNKDRETPLHLTLRRLLPDMAQFLLENGADVNMKNSRGKSPLQFASGRKRREMKRLLLEYSSKHDTVT